MDALNLFIPITKIDAAKRLVYGVATAEQEDRSGEICDYAGTKPLYEKWSGDIAKATDGKSLGNVRAMHGKVAAGKVTSINFNDDAKQIEVCAKVVDDAEWNKVEEGVYTGFSQGGSYVKRWKDEAGQQRYIADPAEISLVDLPCLPSATFQMIKADGMVEEMTFKQPEKAVITNEAVAAKAHDLAKAAGDENKWPDHIEAARVDLEKAAPTEILLAASKETVEPAKAADLAEDQDALFLKFRDQVEQVWTSKDGQTFKTKADAVKHAADLAKVASAAQPLDDATTALAAALGKGPADLPVVTKAFDPRTRAFLTKRQLNTPVAKDVASIEEFKKSISLYSVSNMVELLACLDNAEESLEMDSFWPGDMNASDDLKTRFGAMLVEFGDIVAEALDAILVNLSAEESGEAMARAAQTLDLMKAGARHSKNDKANLQTAHDALVKLGADCGTEKASPAGDLAKGTDLAKVLADNADLKTAMEKAIGMMTDAGKMVVDLKSEVEMLKAQPMPGGAVQLQVVGKEDEATARLRTIAASGDQNALALELIKMSQSRPYQGLPGVNEAMREPVSPAHTTAQ